MVFSLSVLWWRRIRGLWKLPDGRDWLRGNLGPVLMGGAMLSKSLIQFSVEGWSCVPSLLFDLSSNYRGGNEDNQWPPSKGPMQALLHSVPPTLQQSTAEPRLCWRFLDTHGQVWVSLLWGDCSFLLGPGVYKVLFVPSKILFPQSYVSSGGSMMGLMETSSKKAYAIPRSAAPRAPAPAAGHCWPTPPQETLNTQRQVWLSLCGVSWCAQGFVWALWASLVDMGFDSKCNFVPLPSYWGFSFVLGRGVSFFGGIQHSPVHGFQQRAVTSEFLQEKRSAHPSTPPPCRCFRDKTGW